MHTAQARVREVTKKDQHAQISKQTSIPQLGVGLAGLAGARVCNKSERVAMPGGARGTICHQTYPCAHPETGAIGCSSIHKMARLALIVGYMLFLQGPHIDPYRPHI